MFNFLLRIKMRLKYVFIVLAALLFSLGAEPAEARRAQFTAKITSILFFEDGDLIYIYLEGGTKDRPSCAGSNGDYLSFSLKRPRAKEYLAGLMLAFNAGRPVMFVTKGACVDQSVSDTISYFSIY